MADVLIPGDLVFVEDHLTEHAHWPDGEVDALGPVLPADLVVVRGVSPDGARVLCRYQDPADGDLRLLGPVDAVTLLVRRGSA